MLGTIQFKYFMKGATVRTFLGVGTVTEDESLITNEQELCYSEVNIQHKYNCSENTNNAVKKMRRTHLIRINQKEYSEEAE